MVSLRQKRKETGVLRAGEVGFVVAGVKDIHGAPVGDTLTHQKTPEVEYVTRLSKGAASGLFGLISNQFQMTIRISVKR